MTAVTSLEQPSGWLFKLAGAAVLTVALFGSASPAEAHHRDGHDNAPPPCEAGGNPQCDGGEGTVPVIDPPAGEAGDTQPEGDDGAGPVEGTEDDAPLADIADIADIADDSGANAEVSEGEDPPAERSVPGDGGDEDANPGLSCAQLVDGASQNLGGFAFTLALARALGTCP